MTNPEKLNCLTDRPCTVCKYHKENGCSKWSCVFEQEPTTKNDLGVDWENYKDADGNCLDDLILEVLQNNFDCGNTYGYKVADEIIGLLPSMTPQEPKIGHWILQPSNKEQDERDFIWWKCSECGQVIYSETEKDRKEFHAFCGRCGAKMVEPQESEE